MQGGLTDLWLTDPYVVAASKLVAMAEEEHANGRVLPVRVPLIPWQACRRLASLMLSWMGMQGWGTCLGHQLLQILTANTSYNELLVQTDSVVSSLGVLDPCLD